MGHQQLSVSSPVRHSIIPQQCEHGYTLSVDTHQNALLLVSIP